MGVLETSRFVSTSSFFVTFSSFFVTLSSFFVLTSFLFFVADVFSSSGVDTGIASGAFSPAATSGMISFSKAGLMKGLGSNR